MINRISRFPSMPLSSDTIRRKAFRCFSLSERTNHSKKYGRLPGGLILNDETLDKAVMRELKEEAGIDVNYLEQLYSFGSPDRDPRNYVVSISYFGLVRPQDYKLMAQTDVEDVAETLKSAGCNMRDRFA